MILQMKKAKSDLRTLNSCIVTYRKHFGKIIALFDKLLHLFTQSLGMFRVFFVKEN